MKTYFQGQSWNELRYWAVCEILLSSSGFNGNCDSELLNNYAHPCPGQAWVATLTPLESFLRVLGLLYLRESGISPNGNYPKSTNLFLLNWRYSLLAGDVDLAFWMLENNPRFLTTNLPDLMIWFMNVRLSYILNHN